MAVFLFNTASCRHAVNTTRKQSMKKLLSALISASLLMAPLAMVPSVASAKTQTQKKNEAKGAQAKAKSKAKSDARKKK
jgi:Ni/Co efflux regulator RcnB